MSRAAGSLAPAPAHAALQAVPEAAKKRQKLNEPLVAPLAEPAPAPFARAAVVPMPDVNGVVIPAASAFVPRSPGKAGVARKSSGPMPRAPSNASGDVAPKTKGAVASVVEEKAEEVAPPPARVQPAPPPVAPPRARVVLPDSLFEGLDTADGVFLGEVLIVKNERHNCGLLPLGEASAIADFGGLVTEESQFEAAEATRAALAAGLVNCTLTPVMARMHVVRVYYLRSGSLASLPPDKLATARLLLKAFRRNAREEEH